MVSVHALTALVCLEQQQADPTAQPAGTDSAQPAGATVRTASWDRTASWKPPHRLGKLMAAGAYSSDPTSRVLRSRQAAGVFRTAADPTAQPAGTTAQSADPTAQPVGAEAAEDEALRDLLIAATESADDDLPLQDWKVKKSLSSKGGADNNNNKGGVETGGTAKAKVTLGHERPVSRDRLPVARVAPMPAATADSSPSQLLNQGWFVLQN